MKMNTAEGELTNPGYISSQTTSWARVKIFQGDLTSFDGESTSISLLSFEKLVSLLMNFKGKCIYLRESGEKC
jgi:hypothetical protein